MVSGLLQDVRYGIRTLAKSPGFTTVAVVSLALGIGVNLSIFGFVNDKLFKPLPVERPNELASLYHRFEKGSESFNSSSYPEYEFYRDHNSIFSGMLAYLRVPMIMGTGGEAQRISGELVSPDYFSVLGIRPALGRFLLPGETDAAIVIGYSLWQSNFAADPGVLGKTIRIGSGDFTLVGVAPKQFRGIVMDWGDPPSAWIPVQRYAAAVPAFTFDIVHEWGMESYLVTGRLRPGVTMQQASAQIAALTARIREEHGRRKEQSAVLFPMRQARFWPSYRGSILTFLGALMTIVGAVLLISCCNLANLLLARASNRRREIAVRMAIGAGRLQIARQLLIESLLLSCVGGAAAVAIASWASGFLLQFHRPFRIPLAIETGWDVRVFAFALGVSIATGLFFGAAPVLQTWRADLNHALKTASTTTAKARSGLRNALVIGQIALSTVLLVGAGLFVRTLQNARAQDPTLQSENLLVVKLEPLTQGYNTTRGGQFYREALRRVRSIAGVRSAALVNIVPFGGRRGGTDVIAPDQTRQQVDFNIISPGYFQTVGLPLLRGREFSDRDGEAAAAVAVINQLFAARFWPAQDPVGKQFRVFRPSRTLTVLGVVRDGKFRNYRDALRPGFYVPVAQQYAGEMSLQVRTAGSAALLVPAVRREVQVLDSSMPLTDIQTMQARLDDFLSQERLVASLATGLGVLALVLSAVGIYGVLSFSVSRRTREIGIRMAMGAGSGEVAWMIVRESAVLAGAGLAIGAAGAFSLARLAGALLYGVTPTDPVAFGITVFMLVTVAAVAAMIPAYRAASLDPATTLRSE